MALCTTTNEQFKEIKKYYNESFKNDKVIKEYLASPGEAFYHLAEAWFRLPLEVLMTLPEGQIGKGEIHGFKVQLGKYVAALESGKVSGSQLFYVTEAFAKKDPTIYRTLRDYHHIYFNLKGRRVKHGAMFDKIIDELEKESASRGLNTKGISYRGKKITGRTAKKYLNKMTETEQTLIVDVMNGVEGAGDKLLRHREAMTELVENEVELGVYKEMIDYVEKWFPQLLKEHNTTLRSAAEKRAEEEGKPVKYPRQRVVVTENMIRRIRDKDGNPLTENMQTALKNYSVLMEDMWTVLSNGVRTKVGTLRMKMQRSSPNEIAKLDQIEQEIFDRLRPDRVAGFFPHYTTDLGAGFLNGLMPHLDALDHATAPYLKDRPTIDSAMKSISTYIESPHAKGRSAKEYSYSPNFLKSVGAYISDVNRFNYLAYADNVHAKTLVSIENMYKDTKGGLEGYAKNIFDFISDMHMSATGRKPDMGIDNPQGHALMRSVLGFEFISKMGMNLRGAARNFTQRLLDYIEWGPVAIMESKKFWNDPSQISREVLQDVMKSLDKKGITFKEGSPELQESMGASHPALAKVARWNVETGKMEFAPASKLENMADAISNVAGSKLIAGAHRWVENKNRELSYKVGFHQMWKWLNTSAFQEYVVNSENASRKREGKPEITSETEIEKITARKRARFADNYATNMVIINHFDYNDISKANILTKPWGRVLGQFQHFTFAFMERSWDIMKRAKSDVVEGDFAGANFQKAMRYSFIYFLAPVIASAITGIEFGNLIENDTKRRAEELGAWMFGDEEQRKRAFYGRGPVMGNIGAPVMSDLLTIGQLMQFVNMEDDSMLALLSGYEDMSGISGDRRAYEKTRLINTALARYLYREVPQIVKGNIGWAAQSELGLYRSKKGKQVQESVMSADVARALAKIEKVGATRT